MDDETKVVLRYKNGNPRTISHFKNDQFHKENEPALINYYENGNVKMESYFIQGKCHNDKGPAIIQYYTNGNIECERYLINNNYHNIEGPSIINYDLNGNICEVEYFIDNQSVLLDNYEQYDECELKEIINNSNDEIELKKLLLFYNARTNKFSKEIPKLIHGKLVLLKLI